MVTFLFSFKIIYPEKIGKHNEGKKENIITNSLDIEEYAPKKITEEKKQSIVSFERHFS